MIVKLIVVSGKSAGRAIAVKRSKFLIGRADECDIRPLSEEVSRRHCAIVVGPEAVWVEDLGSRNGTFVNGERIAAKTQVTDGDTLRVGALEVRFSYVRQGAGGGSDEDVSKWLMTETDSADSTTAHTVAVPAAVPREAPRGDTVEGSGDGDTVSGSSVNGGSVDAVQPADPAAAEVAAGAKANAGTGRSGATPAPSTAAGGRPAPGGLPQAPAKADSSKDAAAQALKKFFENR